MKRILYFLALSIVLISCEDFLDRQPQDFGSEEAFFNDVTDLEKAANTYYSLLPSCGMWAGGFYKDDEASDNQCSSSPNPLFYKGDKRHAITANSSWKFENIRGINYAINEINNRLKTNSVVGSADLINHYLGELYFFRAYDYFRLLRDIGDAPILTAVCGEDYAELVKLSKRAPRNEVARFILEDLATASKLMLERAPVEGRISKDAALLLRARVALFEGTWLKYHANTPFVPDYANSPYVKKWGPYNYPAGSLEAESNFFLEIAINCADSVACKRGLDANYQTIFNNTSGMFATDEVILARFYKKGVNGHAITNLLGTMGGGTGYTHDLIKSFLLQSGKPIYASSPKDKYPYLGDSTALVEFANRDMRLQMSAYPTGSIIIYDKVEAKKDTIVVKPPIFTTGNEGNPTGYRIVKYVSYEEGQDKAGDGTSATPIFRSAEAYLIYLEAYYERHRQLDAKCDAYWRALRKRAEVDPDYNITINNTDLSKEFDFGKYSHGKLVDKTLYNIRRERRCEFIAEGMRLMDLKRWRSLDNMQNYIVKGFNLWEKMFDYYGVSLEPGKNVSPKTTDNYIQPYGIVSSNSAYLGYNFQIAHYLEPIPLSEFKLTAGTGGDVNNSPIHQNPGWSNITASAAADNSDPSLH